MVGIVVVSHSAMLAEGVVELARQMGGDELALEAAGGLEDGTLGTDVERVRAAIERAMSSDGVLVLYNGVTRATRSAKLAPGTLIRVQVVGRLRRAFGVRVVAAGHWLPPTPACWTI